MQVLVPARSIIPLLLSSIDSSMVFSICPEKQRSFSSLPALRTTGLPRFDVRCDHRSLRFARQISVRDVRWMLDAPSESRCPRVERMHSPLALRGIAEPAKVVRTSEPRLDDVELIAEKPKHATSRERDRHTGDHYGMCVRAVRDTAAIRKVLDVAIETYACSRAGERNIHNLEDACSGPGRIDVGRYAAGMRRRSGDQQDEY